MLAAHSYEEQARKPVGGLLGRVKRAQQERSKKVRCAQPGREAAMTAAWSVACSVGAVHVVFFHP